MKIHPQGFYSAHETLPRLRRVSVSGELTGGGASERAARAGNLLWHSVLGKAPELAENTEHQGKTGSGGCP